MPNGGSDCCGTCWFNSANEGQAKYAPHGVPHRCTIRGDVEIEHPFWTYCANHPHHNSDSVPVPVGPIYVDAGESHRYRRKILVESPDAEEIRRTLLAILEGTEERPKPEYPTSTTWEETAIVQVGRFRERRAVDDLRRIAAFDPYATSDDPFRRNRVFTVACAIEALARILSDEAVEDLRRGILYGRDRAKGTAENAGTDDSLATIRRFAVSSLGCCSPDVARDLAALAADDPDPDVSQAAQRFAIR